MHNKVCEFNLVCVCIRNIMHLHAYFMNNNYYACKCVYMYHVYRRHLWYIHGRWREKERGCGERERERERLHVGYTVHLAKTRLSFLDDHTGNDHSEHENCHHCCCKDE